MALAAEQAAAQCPPGQCNDSYTPYVYFSHDTYGYTAQSPGDKHTQVFGPSRPCHTMKAVTEGGIPIKYQGIRTSNTAPYSRDSVSHVHTLEVEFSVVSNPNENLASRGVLGAPNDYLLGWPSCPDIGMPAAFNLITNDRFQITAGDYPNCCCADATALQLQVSSGALDVPGGQWEAPELVKIKMDPLAVPPAAVCTVDPVFAVNIGTENNFGGWVIQDECESGALFRYPEPLPSTNPTYGYTLQLATSLGGVNGVAYTPDYSEVKMSSHVGQNYPFAASEVIAENSWLEFAIVLVDKDGVFVHPMTGPTLDVGGSAVRPPYQIGITLDVLDQSDWTTPPECSDYLGVWNHYATEGGSNDDRDFLLQVWEEVQPPVVPAQYEWVTLTPNALGLYTVVMGTNQKLKEMRLFARNNDLPPGNEAESHEIVHLHLNNAYLIGLPSPPPQNVPSIDIGWSSDFRFVLQEDGNCE